MAVPSGRPSWHPGRTWPEGPRSPGPGRVCNPVIRLPDGSLQIRPTLKAIPPENQRGPQTEKVRGLAVGSPGGVQSRRPPARSRLEPRAAALATYVGVSASQAVLTCLRRSRLFYTFLGDTLINKWKFCILLHHFIHDEPSVIGLLNKNRLRRWR